MRADMPDADMADASDDEDLALFQNLDTHLEQALAKPNDRSLDELPPDAPPAAKKRVPPRRPSAAARRAPRVRARPPALARAGPSWRTLSPRRPKAARRRARPRPPDTLAFELDGGGGSHSSCATDAGDRARARAQAAARAAPNATTLSPAALARNA